MIRASYPSAVVMCHPSITAAAAEHVARSTGRDLRRTSSGNFYLHAAARDVMPDTKGDSSRTGDSAPGVVTTGNERPSGGPALKIPASAALPSSAPVVAMLGDDMGGSPPLKSAAGVAGISQDEA